MTVDRGAVIWSADPFKADPEAGRPWLTLDNETQPFRDEQSMTVALTTSGYEAALRIRPEDWLEGGLPRESYALPLAVHSPRHRYIDRRLGMLEPAFVDRVATDLHSYITRRSEGPQ